MSMSTATVIPTTSHLVVEIPPGSNTLQGFRDWVYSDDFPSRGRITYIKGSILIDMSPEAYDSHARLKRELTYALECIIREKDLGEIYLDGSWFTHPEAEVSNEPDVMFATWETLKSGRFAPASDKQNYIEMTGSPDWVCEIVSDSSVRKDAQRLRQAYYEANIPEYWLLDARGDDVDFRLLVAGESQYVEQHADPDGYRVSQVFGKAFRVRRSPDQLGRWQYHLESR